MEYFHGSKIPNNLLTGLSLFAVNKDESRCVALSIKARKLSVPDAEKLAILIAIQMAKKLNGKTSIFSDCQGAISIIKEETRNGIPITYVSAHVGIIGNEAANRLAKMGTLQSSPDFNKFWQNYHYDSFD